MRLNGSLVSLQNEIPNALQLQRQVARAIGAVQVRAARGKSVPASAAKLAQLFDQAKAQLTALNTRVRTLTIAPGTVALTSGAPSQQLTVTRVAFDNSSTNVTASGTVYSSSAPGVATVSAGGLVTRVAAGTTVVKATHQGVTAERTVTVS